MARLECLEVANNVTVDDNDDNIDHTPGLAAFVEGLIIGWVTTSTLFVTISRSVNAMNVSFATSPVDFEQPHPELSHNKELNMFGMRTKTKLYKIKTSYASITT